MPQINIIHNRFLYLTPESDSLRKKAAEDKRKNNTQTTTALSTGQKLKEKEAKKGTVSKKKGSNTETPIFVRGKKGEAVKIFSLKDFENPKEKKDKNPDESTPKEKNEVVSKVASINLETIKKLTPYFIKSYYAHDFLTPYIRCFIRTKEYDE